MAIFSNWRASRDNARVRRHRAPGAPSAAGAARTGWAVRHWLAPGAVVRCGWGRSRGADSFEMAVSALPTNGRGGVAGEVSHALRSTARARPSRIGHRSRGRRGGSNLDGGRLRLGVVDSVPLRRHEVRLRPAREDAQSGERRPDLAQVEERARGPRALGRRRAGIGLPRPCAGRGAGGSHRVRGAPRVRRADGHDG